MFRAVLRLFDGLPAVMAMLDYGLGRSVRAAATCGSRCGTDSTAVTVARRVALLLRRRRSCQAKESRIDRALAIVQNVADALYCPLESRALLGDLGYVGGATARWWYWSSWCWFCSTLAALVVYVRRLRAISAEHARLQCRCAVRSGPQHDARMALQRLARDRCDALALLVANACDFALAVHWLPPGWLWADKLPGGLVGLLGIASTLASVYESWPGDRYGDGDGGRHSDPYDDSERA